MSRPGPFLLLLLASCSGRLSHAVDVSIDDVLAVPAGVDVLEVEVEDGSITFRPSPDRQLSISGKCRLAADQESQLDILKGITTKFRASVEGSRMKLQGPAIPSQADPLQTQVAVQCTMELPPQVALVVRASHRGHLSVAGWRAPVHLESGHGDLHLGESRGPAVLRTGYPLTDRVQGGQGAVIVFDHEGDLDVRCKAGGIQAWVENPGQVLSLVTGAGNIQCMIPPDRAFRVEAATQMGKVVNGFGLPNKRLEGLAASFEGQVGVDGTAIVLRSGSGNISLGRHEFQ